MQEIWNEEIKSLELHADNFPPICGTVSCSMTAVLPFHHYIIFVIIFFGTSINLNGKVQSSFNDNVESVMHACIHIWHVHTYDGNNNLPHRQHIYNHNKIFAEMLNSCSVWGNFDVNIKWQHVMNVEWLNHHHRITTISRSHYLHNLISTKNSFLPDDGVFLNDSEILENNWMSILTSQIKILLL